jgi:hypothetical protein
MALNDPEHRWPEDRPEIAEVEGPTAHGDPMGTPAANERVLWKGRPDLAVLSRTAFHTRSVAIYFVALVAFAIALGNVEAAVACTLLGLAALAILHGLAWLSARSTLYILTDARLIMRIGMAIETRINVPLKHIGAAHLRLRGEGHGDIALELNGDRLLGYLLLWPHARPFRLAHPQPMLRAVADAQALAVLLADACAAHEQIERNLTAIKDAAESGGKQASGPASSAATGGKRPPAPAQGLADTGLKGAPA